MHSAPELASQIETLRSPPQVYLRLRTLLEQADVALDELARLITTDPALTASVLRMANSAIYGHRGKIDSVLRGLQLLGVERVHGLVLAAALEASFATIRPPAFDVQRFWRTSVRCALLCRALTRAQREMAEQMFIAGLLADIGHLVMCATVPQLARQARVEALTRGEPLHLAERRIVGCDFAEVGAALLSQWGVPQQYSTLIGTQTLPRLAGEHVLAASALELARCVAEACEEEGLDGDDFAERLLACVVRSELAWPEGGQEAMRSLCEELEPDVQAWLSIFSLAQAA
ncbi:MAG: HDOD domain-containing protein [Thauera sp.]|jgi:HD-like signal output (HDOD) protein|nr:HDOD domain-containing protein [Thauera sp.]